VINKVNINKLLMLTDNKIRGNRWILQKYWEKKDKMLKKAIPLCLRIQAEVISSYEVEQILT
jgi:hypothetical protein